MSALTGGLLRRFIDNIVPLELGTTLPPQSKSHPLGFGIKQATSYPTDGRPRIFLPTSGAGFDRLAAMIGSPINGVSSALHERAWGLLLSAPKAIVEIDVPDTATLLTEGITAAPSKTLRRIVFGSVFHEVSANDAAAYGQVRVAGVVTLTAQMGKKNVTEDVWMDVKWLSTTRALAEHLEPFVDLRQYRVTSAAARLALILLEPHDWERDEGDEIHIQRSAAVAGFSVVIHHYTAATRSAIEQDIRINPSSALVIVGSGYGASKVREAFYTFSNSDRVIHLEQDSLKNLFSTLRENFAGLAGIAPALATYPPVTESSASQRPRLPVVCPTKCLHDGSQRPYVLDGQTNEWWTRDTKGDGGSTFKRYRLDGTELTHLADVDSAGKDMNNKHKGPVGKTVSVQNLHGCSFPASHIE